MAAPETSSPTTRKCAQCGAELPSHLPPDLCPKCLLKLGLAAPPATGPNGTVVVATPEARAQGLPQPGEQLGHYRIVRPLGGGGMGAVFAAEDLESGRQVALKVLSHALDSPEARERFFREGRLAASLNHPNSVYVFGTEEVGGTPVIAMELVTGGTLEERVRALGPLPPAEAVEAVLQIIAGLEAAQRVGILHRDIKPSNCFVESGGTVKIGDFGLSISTAVRTEPALTAAGAFLGTPAFCPPEQLRGDELSARSDMYSVGATLFYLLTGRAPFEAKNVVALIATALEQPAPSPRKFRSNLPRGLAKAVLRCLEKQPAERFKSYDDLRQALAPYSANAPLPATLALRFLAGLLDLSLLNGLSLAALGLLVGFGNAMEWVNRMSQPSLKLLAIALAGLGGSILYYALLEGLWGATVGKALCRLRVVAPTPAGRDAPGFRALGRALIYVVVPVLPFWLIHGLHPKAYLDASSASQYVAGYSFWVMLALLFSTARRRNGFAAIHDLATKTRVVARVALASRPALSASEAPPPAVETRPRLGPYYVLETLEASAGVTWLLGYDLRLLRKVWLRVVPPGTPPVPAPLRNISRVSRLRWLAGRRAPEENWDAFEAVTGKPLLRLLQDNSRQSPSGTLGESASGDARTNAGPQPWDQVRYWLWDLAREVSAAEKDGTLPAVLALDRVWITADGRAKLFDFAAPGASSVNHSTDSTASTAAPSAPSDQVAGQRRDSSEAGPPVLATEETRRFLSEVAAAALEGRPQAAAKAADLVAVPLPLHVRPLLKSLPLAVDAEAVANALKPQLQRVTVVTRWRRAAIVAGCLAFPVLGSLGYRFGVSIMQQWNRSNPELVQVFSVLQARSGLHMWGKHQPGPTDRQFAIYLAGHCQAVITNPASWSNATTLLFIKGPDRRFAEQSVAEHPAPTASELADADSAVKPHLPKPEALAFAGQPSFLLAWMGVSLLLFVGLPAALAALLFRGGLILRIAGVAFVRADGARASRLRLLWRAVLVWGPLLLTLILVRFLRGGLGPLGAGLVAAGLVAGMAILSVALPTRGLADRLAGTWPVPR